MNVNRAVPSAGSQLKMQRVPLKSLHEDPANARVHDERNLYAIKQSLQEFGQVEPLVVQAKSRKVIGGNGRLRVMLDLGWKECDVVLVDLSDAKATALGIALNRTAELAAWDDGALGRLLASLQGDEVLVPGWGEQEVAALLASLNEGSLQAEAGRKLHERFLVPPFSVLDARQGYWRERKAAWVSLGIQSEVGRGSNLLHMSETVLKGGKSLRAEDARFGTQGNIAGDWTGTSVFDPVLCEVAYRWFCPPGGRILDPFAGGSVRGIVAASLGFSYVGVDLREEQVKANEEQAARILGQASRTRGEPEGTSEPDALTPVQRVGPYWLKRDDLFAYAGTNGGKVRALLAFIKANAPKHILVSWCSRESPQQERIARVAKALGLTARIHVPDGPCTPESSLAEQAGAAIVRHKHGRMSVLKARAEKDAEKTGGLLVPWGMECKEAVEATRRQLANLPAEVKRIVVPTGSGVSLAGILWGLQDAPPAWREKPVLAVSVGAAWEDRVARLGPPGAKPLSVKSPLAYEEPAEQRSLEGVALDPIYEAKCIPFLEPGDLLWCVGRREALAAPTTGVVSGGSARWLTGDARDLDKHLAAEERVDLVFTCPPYFDLEKYSDDPADLSNMTWQDFLVAYQGIVSAAAARLRDDRFLILVVGDVRDQDGNFRGLVKESIAAGEQAGLCLYNEAILIPPVGTLALRAARIFTAQRKLGKAHQNVLVFLKGDAARAAASLGPAEFGTPEAEPEEP